ncbi:protein-L-isoaspartate O-methyltransferase [Candidatus Pacearchaeota archaeon]|nr:protein-L-isoaspartate O-methyltransferase [Candidatus Pacearchaeota archaeon]
MNKQKQILLESLKQKGFSPEILNAFSKVKRENFIPGKFRRMAYEDNALPIGKGQTISQPYTIATMLSFLNLKKGQKILEVGSGCGYVLALLSELVGKNGNVFGIETIKELADKSKKSAKNLKNVRIYNKNGRLGLGKKSPFDRILISASCSEIPKPLISQLKKGGILIAPIGNKFNQSLVSFQKINGKLKIIENFPGFIFVPLVG